MSEILRYAKDFACGLTPANRLNIRCRKRFEVAGVQSVAFLNE
jgi:hypothetical protein